MACLNAGGPWICGHRAWPNVAEWRKALLVNFRPLLHCSCCEWDNIADAAVCGKD